MEKVMNTSNSRASTMQNDSILELHATLPDLTSICEVIMWFKMFTSCVLFDQACQTRQNSGGLQRASQDLTKGGLQYFLKILRNENFTV